MYNDINNMPRKQDNKTVVGIILVAVGLLILSRQFFFFPHWIFSWPMILIGIGLYTGYRHNFRNSSWFVFVVLGVAFMVGRFFIWHLIWPLAFIVIGVYIIMRRDGFHNRIC